MAIAGASSSSRLSTDTTLVAFHWSWDEILVTAEVLPIYHVTIGMVIHSWAFHTTAGTGAATSTLSLGDITANGPGWYMAAKASTAAAIYSSAVDGVAGSINTRYTDADNIAIKFDVVANPEIAAGTIAGWIIIGSYT